MKELNLFCYVTCVNGDPEPRARKIVWRNISNLRIPTNCAWCCLGDFNDILSQSEKECKRPRDNYTIEAFRDSISNNDLSDMCLKGCRFTWCNNRSEGHVKERIDHVLTNDRWQVLFPDASLSALPVIGSDHSSLVLQLVLADYRRQRIFKYQEYWESYDEFKQMLQHGWAIENDSNIQRKLSNFTKHLEGWSKGKFKRADVEINRLKRKIQFLENEPFSQ